MLGHTIGALPFLLQLGIVIHMALSQVLVTNGHVLQRFADLLDEFHRISIMLGSTFLECRELSRPGGQRCAGSTASACAKGNSFPTDIHLSKDPGVKLGVSPTLILPVFFAFFSKYFFARRLNLVLYSFSMPLLSL